MLVYWKSAYWRARSCLGRHPALYYTLCRVKKTDRDLRVTKATNFVLEGYPRCANTFAAWLMHSRHPEVKLAHHVHVPAQVIAGVRRNLPVCVLIRNPADAVASFLVYSSGVSPDAALADYLSFYTAILPYQDDYVLADFDEVTKDFGAVLGRVNGKFGTEFNASPVTSEESEKMFRLMEGGVLLKMTRQEDRVARPSEARREKKQRFLKQLPPEKLAAAEGLYRQYIRQGD
jgi:hypothetical protein